MNQKGVQRIVNQGRIPPNVVQPNLLPVNQVRRADGNRDGSSKQAAEQGHSPAIVFDHEDQSQREQNGRAVLEQRRHHQHGNDPKARPNYRQVQTQRHKVSGENIVVPIGEMVHQNQWIPHEQIKIA